MTCMICGCKEEIMVHGHYQCAACGRMSYECCQGEQEHEGKDTPDTDEPDVV